MKYEYGNWFLVIISIALFMFFIKSVFKPRTKTDWTTYGTFSAFIIALFAEMYGFPLTIYLFTSFFGNRLGIDFSHDSGHILNRVLNIGGDPHFSILHIISDVLVVGGLLLISSAWKILYEAQKKGVLATTGAYKYIRHPQYAGFIIMIIGFLLQWPTLITFLMAPILIIRYILLAKQEEKEISKKISDIYSEYKKETPGFFPSFITIARSAFRKLNYLH